MKIKVSDATNLQLDWLVGIAQGWTVYPNDSIEHGDTFHLDPKRTPFGPILRVSDFHPSTDWSQGGPIIERAKLELGYSSSALDDLQGWYANKYNRGLDAVPGAAAGDSLEAIGDGPTPLIAAMRCYVASKLGNEVEVPDELI